METISKDQWQKIQTLARRTRDSADKFSKPSNHLHTLYVRSYVEAQQLGYGGDGDEWRDLCLRILD